MDSDNLSKTVVFYGTLKVSLAVDWVGVVSLCWLGLEPGNRKTSISLFPFLVDGNFPPEGGEGAELGDDDWTLHFLFWRVGVGRRCSTPLGAAEVSRGEPGRFLGCPG